MRRSARALGLVASLLSGSLPAPPAGAAAIRADAAADPELAKGTDEVKRGDYDAAIATLTSVVRRLREHPDRDAEAAVAYLQLGIAYAGLGQVSPAKSQFVQALKRDPSLAPDPKTTPPEALEAFATARREGVSEGVVSKDQKPPKKKGGGTKVLIAAGVVGAGLGIAAAAGGGGSDSSSPVQHGPAFVPIAASPYIVLQSVNPGPGSQFPSLQTVSVSVSSKNVGTEEFSFIVVAEALTDDGRACMSGHTATMSYGPGATIGATFSMHAACPAPFTTVSLQISLADPDTGVRRYHASYSGSYRVTP
jgi:hypothetical protein